jgi:hypothetical protein
VARVTCYHCGVENDVEATAGYCDSCGKKLPSPTAFRDRQDRDAGNPDPVESEPQRGEWDAGVRDYADRDFRLHEPTEEQKAARKQAAGTLFAVAGLQVVCGVTVGVAAPALGLPMDAEALIFTVILMVGLGIFFSGLGSLGAVSAYAGRHRRARCVRPGRTPGCGCGRGQ